MEYVFNEELLKDERVLWEGKPNINVMFTGMDYFLVPFSLIWCTFAIFWEMGTLELLPFSNNNEIPTFLPLFGIPFVLIGLYFVFGRFLYKRFKKKNTFYAITNKRVLIVTNLKNKSMQSKYINTINSINYSQKNNGMGTIRFGEFNLFADMYENTGLVFFSLGKPTLAFFDIDDVQKIYRLINSLKNND